MTKNPQQAEGDSGNAVKIRQGKGDERNRKSFNCGREGHLASYRSCPANGKKCARCGRYGQFALCCRGEIGGQRQRVSGRRPRHNANFVGDQEVSDSEEDCAFAFTVTEDQEETYSVASGKEPVDEVSVYGVTTVVLIDSGSVSNLMGMKQYKELKARGLNEEMENCHKRLHGYGGKELEVMG